MIDPKLQAELRARYNPDGSDLRKMQLRMLEMLKYIDKICRENNIKYWLSSGTCLGAVRHGGFIPWDDDCDIEMLQKDYNRLVKVMRGMENPKYPLQTHHNDKAFFPRFGKIRDLKSRLVEWGPDRKQVYEGVYIDVFPIRRSSSLTICRFGDKILKVAQFYTPLLYKTHYLTLISQLVSQTIVAVSGVVLNALQRIGKTKYYRHTSPAFFAKERCLEDIFPLKDAKFEGLRLPVPFNTDGYLTKLYGRDYMSFQIAPVPENGISKHIRSLIFFD